jgi:hypothetical protein
MGYIDDILSQIEEDDTEKEKKQDKTEETVEKTETEKEKGEAEDMPEDWYSNEFRQYAESTKSKEA